jgi:pilus assembly protein CpaE
MAGTTILCVDDDSTTRKLLSSVLERQGYRVRTADDGLDALRIAGEQPPDLVITDVQMPHLSGLELTHRLRIDQRTAHVPVIMLSDRKRNEEMLAGYAEGADDYVPKPVDMAVLTAKVAALLQRARRAAPPQTWVPEGTVVVFLHGKGGVGTTTLAVNTAVALAAPGARRVALLDLNLEFGNAAIMLDLQPQRTLAALGDVPVPELDDEAFARFSVVHASGARVVVGADAPEAAEMVTPTTVQQVIARLRAQVDYLVIDTASSCAEINLVAIDMADALYVVTSPQLPAVKATGDYLRVLEKLEVPTSRVRVIVNRITPGGLENELIAKTLNRKLEAVIPYAAKCEDAANAGRPLVTYQPSSVGALEMENLAAKIAPLVAAAA